MGVFDLITDDVINWATRYSGPQFHALLSDFPYDLGFMGKNWDKNAKFREWGSALLSVLHPGALSLVFGGTRTWHRLAVGMETAGFEMWDTMMWLYGSGFAKNQSISKHISDLEQQVLWTGYTTSAFKPAWEPILCFKRPLEGTYAECALIYGSGSLNMEAGRIPTTESTIRPSGTNRDVYGRDDRRGMLRGSTKGRVPANFLLDEEAAKMLGEKNRFFYSSKSNSQERNAGLPVGLKNDHPAVKPVSLTTYLAKLLLPPASIYPRRIAVPFSGSGSEIIGCLLAGWDEVIGIELIPEYNVVARHRCKYALVGGYDRFTAGKDL
jgi:DNA modification methylase